MRTNIFFLSIEQTYFISLLLTCLVYNMPTLWAYIYHTSVSHVYKSLYNGLNYPSIQTNIFDLYSNLYRYRVPLPPP